jgi:hypothetical protein
MLSILLLGDLFAEFALWRKQSAVNNFERFVVLRFGQRALPQIMNKQLCEVAV